MDVIWDQLRREDWEATIGAAPLQQHWAYGAVAARLGAQVRRAQVTLAGGQVAHVQCLIRRFGPLRVAWHGLATPGADAVGRALRAEGPLIWLSPGAGGFGAGRDHAWLDLTGPDLRAGLRGKWRNRLVVAERAGIDVQQIDTLPPWLIAAEAAQQKQARYRNLPQAWIESWHRYAPGGITTLIAGRVDAPIAAVAFLRHGASASYLMGWTGPEGRRASAHNLLIWQAMARLSQDRVQGLDLGGLNPKTAGLNRFKLGTGAEIRHVPPIAPQVFWRAAQNQRHLGLGVV